MSPNYKREDLGNAFGEPKEAELKALFGAAFHRRSAPSFEATLAKARATASRIFRSSRCDLPPASSSGYCPPSFSHGALQR